MKLKTVLAAPVDATVRDLRCSAGQVVTAGQLLVVLAPTG